ncbi:MAG: aminotransferase class V-fold PLP-dependent enzyme [Ruminococcus sp.]|nr:aminotransferase class V-fold PLP-dependent enzyme [Ruminococcus sp.]
MAGKRFVYADNAATTRVSAKALEAALPFFSESFGNPSSIHSCGMAAARAVLRARQSIAGAIGAGRVSEVYFTSGGTESDNWALRSGTASGAEKGRRHIVTTAIEHHAVLETCSALEREGFEVTYLAPDREGLITAGQVEAALREDTAIVSVMTANNEIGTLQPVSEIGKLCRERGVLFHTDAVAAAGSLKIDVNAMNADMLTLSGHKLHAPKGVGVLYVRSGVELKSFMNGGSQERGRRAGTENVPAIVALGEVISGINESVAANSGRVTEMRDRLIRGLLEEPESRLNGSAVQRLSGNVNISFEGIEGESLIMALDRYGICASSGSACASGSSEPSHVLSAIGLTRGLAKGSLRLTINEENCDEDIDYILRVVPEAVRRLRAGEAVWGAGTEIV